MQPRPRVPLVQLRLGSGCLGRVHGWQGRAEADKKPYMAPSVDLGVQVGGLEVLRQARVRTAPAAEDAIGGGLDAWLRGAVHGWRKGWCDVMAGHHDLQVAVFCGDRDEATAESRNGRTRRRAQKLTEFHVVHVPGADLPCCDVDVAVRAVPKEHGSFARAWGKQGAGAGVSMAAYPCMEGRRRGRFIDALG